MSIRFKDQVVWITGASSGIGAALAAQFVSEGALVALSARREDKLQALANALGSRAQVFVLDVQKKAEVEKTALSIKQAFGKIDVVVANAGYSAIGPLENLTEAMWRKQFDTNVFGAVWTLQASIPHLRETKGRIGIITSVVGKLAMGHSSAYSSSKFALTAIANALYQELYGSGISVTNIAPGWIESEIHQIDNFGEPRQKKIDINHFGLMWPTQKAAKVMVRALYERKREEVVTGHGKLAAFLGTHLAPLTYWGLAKVSANTPLSRMADKLEG